MPSTPASSSAARPRPSEPAVEPRLPRCQSRSRPPVRRVARGVWCAARGEWRVGEWRVGGRRLRAVPGLPPRPATARGSVGECARSSLWWLRAWERRGRCAGRQYNVSLETIRFTASARPRPVQSALCRHASFLRAGLHAPKHMQSMPAPGPISRRRACGPPRKRSRPRRGRPPPPRPRPSRRSPRPAPPPPAWPTREACAASPSGPSRPP
mmetsp:Transcript_3118/g.12838  ORF Transcript_3118/g.12838 Transcript_3118/m.12838 type:complete len:211 (+) Transcript_3118:1346-1978(+)